MPDVRVLALDEWDATIVAVARSVSRRYSMVDWQDVAQELRLWWLSTDRVTKYLADDSEDRSGQRKLLRALQLEASGYCQKEKARAAGYRIEDVFFYSTGALRDLLVLVFDYDNWIQTVQRQEDTQPRAAANPAEGNNLVVALADVSAALGKLREQDREVLELIFRDGFSEQELAEDEGVTPEAIVKRVDRALVRLREVLGGEQPFFHEGPGSRRVLSNSAAQAQTGV